MNRIIFLGSGAGRQMIASQERKTGGIYLEFGSDEETISFSLDPGPGALVNAVSLGLRPEKWKGVFLSHHHIDHSNDANAILDTINTSDPKNKKFPFIIAEEHCLVQKKGSTWPVITEYHQSIAKKVSPIKAGDIERIGKLEVKAVKAVHYSPVVGFVFDYENLRIGYPSDGSYYKGQESHFDNCQILVLNCPWPKGHEAPKGIHMTLDDAIELVKAIKNKPKLVVLSHLSPYMLRANLFKQEKIFAEATKVKCISASDFLEIDINSLNSRILKPIQRV